MSVSFSVFLCLHVCLAFPGITLCLSTLNTDQPPHIYIFLKIRETKRYTDNLSSFLRPHCTTLKQRDVKHMDMACGINLRFRKRERRYTKRIKGGHWDGALPPANSLTVPIKQRLLNQFTMRNAVFEYWELKDSGSVSFIELLLLCEQDQAILNICSQLTNRFQNKMYILHLYKGRYIICIAARLIIKRL